MMMNLSSNVSLMYSQKFLADSADLNKVHKMSDRDEFVLRIPTRHTISKQQSPSSITITQIKDFNDSRAA